jgi:hypothetical protein
MAAKFRDLRGIDYLGTIAICLLSNSLAPTTYVNYASALRQFCIFCDNESIRPLHATPATMIRYTTWLGQLGTIAAGSLQPYFFVVNKIFRDHPLLPIAIGELLVDSRLGPDMHMHRLTTTTA